MALATLAVCITIATAAAQQADLKAGVSRLRQYIDTGNYPAAIAEAQNLEATVKARFGTKHPNYTIALNNLIVAYKAQANNFYIPQGDYAPAAELYERVLAIEEQAKGANHPEVAETANNLGALYWWQGRYPEAERHWKRALAIREVKFGKDHLQTASSLHSLFNVHAQTGRLVEAEALAKRALVLARRRSRRSRGSSKTSHCRRRVRSAS